MRLGLLTVLAGVLFGGLAGGCAPKMTYDTREGTLSRSDGAFSVPLSARQRISWQIEVPGEGGAPKRYPFDYDAIVYRIRPGRPGSPPDVLIVLAARRYPASVRDASPQDRGARILETVRSWLRQERLAELAVDDDDRFYYDGRTLTTSVIDVTQALDKPGLGAAFIFGAENVLQAIYELYPASSDEPMSAKEVQETLQAVALLLASISVH